MHLKFARDMGGRRIANSELRDLCEFCAKQLFESMGVILPGVPATPDRPPGERPISLSVRVIREEAGGRVVMQMLDSWKTMDIGREWAVASERIPEDLRVPGAEFNIVGTPTEIEEMMRGTA